MPATVDEVKQVISEEFPESDVAGIIEEGHRIGGTFFWPKFKGMDFSERNRLVTRRVRDRLGLHGINIGFLFPLAPGEKL